MKRILKWIGIVLGGLVGLALIAALALYFNAESRLNKVYTIKPEAVVIPTDTASVARGEHLTDIFCSSCHGTDFSGTLFFKDPALGNIPAPNLTPGMGGVGNTYRAADWVRVIRHGVKADGTPVFIMPSENTFYLDDTDLGEIVAYLEQLPPVDKQWPAKTISPLAHILISAGAFGNVFAAETIDHSAARPSAPVSSPTVDYGDYLVKTVGCRDCHGKNLTGGKSADPAAPPVPDITAGGVTTGWTPDVFITMARTLKSKYMPWEDLNAMTDDELLAVWAYLQSMPAPQASK